MRLAGQSRFGPRGSVLLPTERLDMVRLRRRRWGSAGRDGRPSLPTLRRAGPEPVDRGNDPVDGRPGLADLAIICESRETRREASRALSAPCSLVPAAGDNLKRGRYVATGRVGSRGQG